MAASASWSAAFDVHAGCIAHAAAGAGGQGGACAVPSIAAAPGQSSAAGVGPGEEDLWARPFRTGSEATAACPGWREAQGTDAAGIGAALEADLPTRPGRPRRPSQAKHCRAGTPAGLRARASLNQRALPTPAPARETRSEAGTMRKLIPYTGPCAGNTTSRSACSSHPQATGSPPTKALSSPGAKAVHCSSQVSGSVAMTATRSPGWVSSAKLTAMSSSCSRATPKGCWRTT